MLTVPLSFRPDPDTWTVRVHEWTGETDPVILDLRPNAHVTCPECGRAADLTPDTPFVVADLPHGDRPVLLRYRSGTVTCRCGHGGRVHVPDIRRGRSGMGWTDALARYLTRRAADTTDDLRLRTGLPNTRIRELVQQGLRDMNATRPTTLDVVGIDELYFGKQRYAVVTDISRRRLLACVPVATTVDGLSDRIDLRDVLRALPVPATVTLDMNPAVLDIVRNLWKTVKLVIDKRHVLQTADRTYRPAIRSLVNTRQGRPADSVTPLYGEAAYQSYRLRDLMTMRAASCTVTDLAAWRLIREEHPDLLQLYRFREQLYETFSAPWTPDEFTRRLRAWSREVDAWRTKSDNKTALGGALQTIRMHETNLVTYQDDQVTNAFTEAVNARLREHIRRGRRYGPETLVALVNGDLAREQAARVAPGTRIAATDPLEPAPPDRVARRSRAVGNHAAPPAPEPDRQAGRRAVPVNRHWPEPMRRWLRALPSRARQAAEADLTRFASPADRPGLLAIVRSVETPLPSTLEREGVIAYLRTLPNMGLPDTRSDLLAFLRGEVPLPARAQRVVTALARGIAEGEVSDEYHRSRMACRQYNALRQGPADPDRVLESIDGLRRQLVKSESYGSQYVRLMRIDEAAVPRLLEDMEACWIVAAWPCEPQDMRRLGPLADRLISRHEQTETEARHRRAAGKSSLSGRKN